VAWARIDDAFYDHPKFCGLLSEPDGWALVGFWTACLAWAHRHTRKPGKIPGFVPHSTVVRMDRAVGLTYAQVLVKHGLWEAAEGGYLIHDFGMYLPSAKETVARVAGGLLGAHRRWHDGPYEECPKCHTTDCIALSHKPIARSQECDGSCVGHAGSFKELTSNHNKPVPPARGEQATLDVPAPKRDSPEFTEFWSHYPRKVGKEAARRAWKTVITRRKVPAKTVIAAAARYKTHCPADDQYVPHPATWLNDGRYDDEQPRQVDDYGANW
jgi:hypothetical protein